MTYRHLGNKKDREYWFFVAKNSFEISTWPDWKRASIIDGTILPRSSNPAQEFITNVEVIILAAREELADKKTGSPTGVHPELEAEYEKEISGYEKEIDRVKGFKVPATGTPEKRRLKFGPGLMLVSLYGDERFTVRRYQPGAHEFKKDEIIIGEFQDGLDILLRITRDTVIGPFRDIKSPKKSRGQKGYYFDRHFFSGLKAYYEGLKWGDTGAIIFFEVLKIGDDPVVAANQHMP